MDIIQNTEKVQTLINALDDYSECLTRRNTCYQECQYSPGYHCASYNHDLEVAAGAFGAALNALIDERVQQILAQSPHTN